jgi:long-chain acyl-CoA synthetase
MDWVEKDGSVTSMFLDPLIFSKIRNLIGSRVRIVFSSSGPLSNEIINFLKISFCTDVISVYG